MTSLNIRPTHLTNEELKQRLNAVIRKMRRLFDLDRWKSPEDFEDYEKGFLREASDIDLDLIRLKAAMKLTKQIDWYEKSKRRKRRG